MKPILRLSLAAVPMFSVVIYAAAAAPVTIKTGTVAPDGSPWAALLKEISGEWKDTTNGAVQLRVYPGGVLGDEADLVKKLRIGQLQAVALSGAGMELLVPEVACLQVPLMLESYAELDAVREQAAPELEAILLQRGYVVLNWGDAGWVHFFSRTRARTPDDMRAMKLFTSASDARSMEIYKSNGFHPVPLALADMLTALQTGMIDALDVPPLMMLLSQWYPAAHYMLDLKWAPLVGATIVSATAWERVAPADRARLLKISRDAAVRERDRIRRMNDEAITAMQAKGLVVTPVDDATRAVWRREVTAAYPRLRGTLCPAPMFDRVQQLRDAYRAGPGRP